MSTPDDDLALMTISTLASLLGRSKQAVTRLVDSGAIPVTYVDADNGERYFTRAVLLAQQRRLGELHAEALAAERATQRAAAGQAVDAQDLDEPDEHVVEEPVAESTDAVEELRRAAPVRPAIESSGWSLDRTLNAAIAQRNAAQLRAAGTKPSRQEPAGGRRPGGRRPPPRTGRGDTGSE